MPEPTESACPDCGGKMTKNFSSISGNSKYIVWQCEECQNKVTKCLGVMR